MADQIWLAKFRLQRLYTLTLLPKFLQLLPKDLFTGELPGMNSKGRSADRDAATFSDLATVTDNSQCLKFAVPGRNFSIHGYNPYRVCRHASPTLTQSHVV